MAKQTFTAGQVLTAAEMNSLQENDYNWTVTTKTASYTLAAGDEGTRIVMNNAGATTITVDDAVFAAGDVVWLHNIGAGTCTITAGTATVNTDGSLALEQYQGGQLFFTSASSAIFFPNVGAQAGGKILQVVSTTKTDLFTASVAAGASTAVTGLSATITPSSASSTILVLGQVNAAANVGGYLEGVTAVLTRGGTAICIGDSAGSRSRGTSSGGAVVSTGGLAEIAQSISILFLDSPATTSATTYAVEVGHGNTGTITVTVNSPGNSGLDRSDAWRTTSTITVLEVSA